jgi:hypothetical protein
MSANSQSESEDWGARMRAQTEYATDRGEQWLKHYGKELERLPQGTIVVINCRNGEYVTAKTRREATDAFEQRFGKDVGFLIEIGGGTFVGGGFG